MTQFIYAGIGSRDTPAEVLDSMKVIATELTHYGWMLRSEARKLEATAQKAGEQVQNAVAPQQQSNQHTTTTSTTSVGNINPDDVLRQASQLRLGDTIN